MFQSNKSDENDDTVGAHLIGHRLRVFWPAEDTFYAGEVCSFDERTGKHEVQYDDGDTEHLQLDSERVEFISGRNDSFAERTAANKGGRVMRGMHSPGLRFVTVMGPAGVSVSLMPASSQQNPEQLRFVFKKRKWVLKFNKKKPQGLLEFPCDANLIYSTEEKALEFLNARDEDEGYCEEPMTLTQTRYLAGKRDRAWLVEHSTFGAANCKVINDTGGQRCYLQQIRDIKVGERLRFNYRGKERYRLKEKGIFLSTLPQQLPKSRSGKPAKSGPGRPPKTGRRFSRKQLTAAEAKRVSKV